MPEAHKENRLKYYTINANQDQQQDDESSLLLNMSIAAILKKFSSTFNAVLEDLLEWNKPITKIFLSEDRLMYCGLMLVLISFTLWLVGLT